MFEMFLKKKEPELVPTGPYAFIEWKPIARELCVGGDEFKQIVVYDQHGNIIAVYYLTRARIRELEKQGIPVINLTEGQEMPPECLASLDIISPMGVIFLGEEI